MRRFWGMATAIALLLGCQPQPGPTTVKPKATGTAKPRPAPSASATPLPVGSAPAPIPLSEPQRIVQTDFRAVTLIGKVKLISDNGASIISNNTGSLVSNNGGAVIGNNGSGYRVRQAGGTGALPEALLADAQIEVLDAAGQVLVTPDKKPITATTDATGNYQLKANLPTENLILRVRLYQGGQLFAFLTRDKAAATVHLDTASSLGAAYVMDKYVKKQQNVLNLLPGLEVDKLQADMEAARVHLTGVPSYRPQDLVTATEQLRGKAPALEQTIQRIEAILLAGQANLGNGLPANQVAIASPSGLMVDPAGNVYVAESTAGRIRKITPDGMIYTYAGTGALAPRDGNLGLLRQIALGPDGTMYAIKRLANQVVRYPANGAPVVIAGSGENRQGPVGGKATETALRKPHKITVAADGTVYLCEYGTLSDNLPARVLFIDAAGMLRQVPMPEGRWTPGEVHAFTVGPDGTIWLIGSTVGAETDKLFLARLVPGGSWEFVAEKLAADANFDMVVGPDGALYVSCQSQSRILKYDANGQATTVAGSSRAGFAGDGGPATAAQLNGPRGIGFGPDGALYVADEGNGLIRKIGKDGLIRTIGGVTGLTQVGDALTVSINQPVGLAIDPQGRLVVAEAASHTIKRLEGNQLTVVAGTLGGFSGDGGAATAAALRRPNGIAYHQGALYVLDFKNSRLRKIDASGIISTLAGGRPGHPTQASYPALEAPIESPFAVAIDAAGVPYWSDNKSHVIMRLKDGQVERVAGALNGASGHTGDGGAAKDAKLSGPTGLVFDKDGNLFVADSANLRIRKIDPAGVITTVAGLDKAGLLALLGAGTAATQNNTPGLQTALWGPLALQFDGQGNLYFTEAGTVSASIFGEGDSGVKMGFDTSQYPPELVPKTYPRIRKLTPEGRVVNVTGPGTSLLSDISGDNTLLFPLAIAFDKDGRMVIGDSGANQLKVLPKGAF